MFLASRSRRGTDRYVRWKMAALVLGALLVLAGARLGQPPLVWAGIGALAVGFALRFLPQRSLDGERGAAITTNDEESP